MNSSGPDRKKQGNEKKKKGEKNKQVKKIIKINKRNESARYRIFFFFFAVCAFFIWKIKVLSVLKLNP